jgi:hypothetical protein
MAPRKDHKPQEGKTLFINALKIFLVTLLLSMTVVWMFLFVRQTTLPDIILPSETDPNHNHPTTKEDFTSSVLRAPIRTTTTNDILSSNPAAPLVLEGTGLSPMQKESKAFTDINRTPPSNDCDGNGNCRDYVLGYIPEKDPCDPPLDPQYEYWYFPNLADRPCPAYSSSNAGHFNDDLLSRYPRCPSDAGQYATSYTPFDVDKLSVPKI